MKGVILVLAVDAVLFSLLTLILRTGEVRGRAAMIVRAFLTFIPIYVLISRWTPDDLWFLVEPWGLPLTLDMYFGLFFFTASVLGGFLQLYNLADRGLFLRVLVDLYEDDDGIMTPREIITEFSSGKGLNWLSQKRIDGLVELGLIQISEETATLTKSGRRWTLLLLGLRRLLKCGDPKEV